MGFLGKAYRNHFRNREPELGGCPLAFLAPENETPSRLPCQPLRLAHASPLFARGDMYWAAGGHRIARVDDEVEQSELELVGVGLDPAQTQREMRFKAHRGTKRTLQQIAHAAAPLRALERIVQEGRNVRVLR